MGLYQKDLLIEKLNKTYKKVDINQLRSTRK